MSKGWKRFETLSVGFLLALSINLLLIFFLAYFNGGGVMVIVDKFSEQHVEAILLPILFVMGVVTFIRMLRRCR